MTREEKQGIINEALKRYEKRFCVGMWNPDNKIRDAAINQMIYEICAEKNAQPFKIMYTQIGIFEI